MKKPSLLPAVLGFTIYVVGTPALLFISASSVDWPMAWVYVALSLAATLGGRLIVSFRNPETLRERARLGQTDETLPGDRILVLVVGLLGPMSMMIVAGLDHRWGTSMEFPVGLQISAIFLVIVSFDAGVWAMVSNPYFSAVARIQDDRDQVVVSTGPYRIVRHPSYTGAVLASLAIPIMLGSIWTLIPGLISIIAVVIRTNFEDRMLLQGLDGYRAYAAVTRHRHIPGIW
jgi:protein-S-isoprenylcysteine O-methyltransferase Ste14